MFKHYSWLNKKLFQDPAEEVHTRKYPELNSFRVNKYLYDQSIEIHYFDIVPSINRPVRTLLFFHGAYSNLDDYYVMLKNCADVLRARVLALEYPGYGLSKGYISNEAIIHDWAYFFVEYAIRNLSLDYEKAFIMGLSMGTGVALEVVHHFYHVKKKSPHMVLLISTFIDFRHITYEKNFFFYLISQNRFNNLERISSMNGFNLCVIHGNEDDLIPIEHAKRLYSAYPSEKKKFITVVNKGHRFKDPSQLLQLFLDYLNEK